MFTSVVLQNINKSGVWDVYFIVLSDLFGKFSLMVLCSKNKFWVWYVYFCGTVEYI